MNNIDYIFSDFDGTITKKDVVYSFVSKFAKGDWSYAEGAWLKGEISTKECIQIQMSFVKDVKKEEFFDFLNSVEIDEGFIEFYKYLKKYNKKLVILSDGFDYFIEYTLKKHNLDEIKFHSNHLNIIEKNGILNFEITYPNQNKNCLIKSGCCKCQEAGGYTSCYLYIGDGLSDRCIAKKARLLFAKKSLETFCKNENISYFPYKNFQDVLNLLYKENFHAADNLGGFDNRL